MSTAANSVRRAAVTAALPAPARLPATRLPAQPIDVRSESDQLLKLAEAAINHSWEVSGSRDSIEQLGQAVIDLVEELATRTRERDEAREDFARSRALHADTKVGAAPRLRSMVLDEPDTIVMDAGDLPSGRTLRMPAIANIARSQAGR